MKSSTKILLIGAAVFMIWMSGAIYAPEYAQELEDRGISDALNKAWLSVFVLSAVVGFVFTFLLFLPQIGRKLLFGLNNFSKAVQGKLDESAKK